MGLVKRAADGPRWVVWGSRVLFRGASDLYKLARGGNLAEAMEPWMRVQRADEIPWDKIAAEGFRAALFDLENTLIPPGGPFDESGRGVVAAARAAGLEVAVVSNASAGWVAGALEAEGIAGIAPAGKPASSAFHDACEMLGVPPSQAVYIGDQVITDVLGSQRAGLRAILVEPKFEKEFASSKFQRAVVKAVLRLTGPPKAAAEETREIDEIEEKP
jgi:HAD superfamily phosphatase (TIGR01668 family)